MCGSSDLRCIHSSELCWSNARLQILTSARNSRCLSSAVVWVGWTRAFMVNTCANSSPAKDSGWLTSQALALNIHPPFRFCGGTAELLSDLQSREGQEGAILGSWPSRHPALLIATVVIIHMFRLSFLQTQPSPP